MSTGTASRILITPVFRMSYPNLITPRKFNDKGEPRYTVDALFKPNDLTKFFLADDTVENGFREVDIRQVLVEIGKEKWPNKSLKETLHKDGWPLRVGDKKADEIEAKGKKGDAYRGHTVITMKASAAYPPNLKVKDKGKTVNLDLTNPEEKKRAEQLFIGGYYARAEVNAKAIDTPDNYLTFYVNNLMFVKQGEKLGSGSALDRFDGIHGGDSDFDPTAGLDDEISF